MYVNFNRLGKFIGTRPGNNIVFYKGVGSDYEHYALDEALDWYRDTVASETTSTVFMCPKYTKVNGAASAPFLSGLNGVLDALDMVECWDGNKVIVLVEPTEQEGSYDEEVMGAVDSALKRLQRDNKVVLIWYTADNTSWRPTSFNQLI